MHIYFYLLLKNYPFIFLNYEYNLIYKFLQHIHSIYIYIYILSIIINTTIVHSFFKNVLEVYLLGYDQIG